MLFHSFSTQEERQATLGGDALELQYRAFRCDDVTACIAIDVMDHWRLDSLYFSGDDVNDFDALYGDLFTGGYYNNGQQGSFDWCGLNYYPPRMREEIVAALRQSPRRESDVLLRWLEDKRAENGFYLLGL